MSWIAIGVALPFLLTPGPAQAQDGVGFTLPIDVTIGRDYGFLARDRKFTDELIVVRLPQFNFTSKSPRADLSTEYQAEFEVFDDNRSLNAMNHRGLASFTFRITRRLTFDAGADALVTQDPTRSIPGILMLLPRGSFKQNKAHAAINYSLTQKNTVSVAFDNVAADAPDTPAFPGGSGVRNAGAIALAHRFGPKSTATATYSLLSGNAQFAGLSYETGLAHDLTVRLSAGLLKDNGLNYLVSAHIEKSLGAVWVNGGYHRFLSMFGTSTPGTVPIGNDLLLPDGVSRTNVFQVFQAGVSRAIIRRAGVEVRAAVTRNESGTADRNINNFSGRFKLDYGLTDRLKVYTDLQFYSQAFNVFVGELIDRRRYVAGIQFDVSTHPNRVSNFPGQNKPSPR